MRIRGTHHVALVTARFDELLRFYVEVLEMPVVGGFPDHRILFLDAGGTRIELLAEDEAEERAPTTFRTPGWNHLALEVEDVDAAYAELAARGVPFASEPEDFPPEAPALRIAFLRDPDGNLVELLQSLDQREAGNP